RQELVKTLLTPCQVALGVVPDVLDEQVVPRGVADEDGIVFEHEVESGRVRLVLDQLGSVDLEYLDPEAESGSEQRVRAQMARCAGETNQGTVVARLGVDALRVLRRQVGQYLDLGLGQA